MSILVIFLHGFRWLWDQFWWLLVAWGQAWNIMIFDGFPGGPGREGALPFQAIWYTFWPYSNSQTVSRRSTTCKIQHQTCRNKGIRKNQDANYENTKKQGCNMISLQQRKQDTGSRRCLAAWWPLYRGAGGLFIFAAPTSAYNYTHMLDCVRDLPSSCNGQLPLDAVHSWECT